MKTILFFVSISFLCASAFSKEINLAASLAIPPYISDGGASGMEVEIVKNALEKSGHNTNIELYPLKRVYDAVKAGKVDAAMTVVPSSEHSDLYFSNSHVAYQNVAVSLERNSFPIQGVDDLENYSIIAFQNATKYLGDDYSSVIKKAKSYSEKANQDVQIAMLFSGKTDVIVLDINIFRSLIKSESRVNTNQKYVIHELFPKVNMTVAFNDETIMNDFNNGLKIIRESGEYQSILNKYVN
ncbi:substrate-binding periplasmic protein [Planctobacterium marinum]|uniref:substrate-binding periplasmic protein n=1 Tax=Planctobacterium marinum TaxID=1631968 RepID=UPI001E5F35CB|nr:transporter substrate-binding domain-containing protein [Planctobacterium marinum]MCC2605734.1 transporter substrate-binding domain-containing protein [Planctobacterium marinum]